MDYLERLVIEERELSEKIVKLNEALKFGMKISEYQISLLHTQLATMLQYQGILRLRLDK